MISLCAGCDSDSVFILVAPFIWFSTLVLLPLLSFSSLWPFPSFLSLSSQSQTRMTSRCGQSFFLHLKLAAIEEWQESMQSWMHWGGDWMGDWWRNRLEVEEGICWWDLVKWGVFLVLFTHIADAQELLRAQSLLASESGCACVAM